MPAVMLRPMEKTTTMDGRRALITPVTSEASKANLSRILSLSGSECDAVAQNGSTDGGGSAAADALCQLVEGGYDPEPRAK
jgi:hypothetical protein